MSPAMKSKSKDKSSTKAVKEQQQKTPSKVLALPVNGGNSAYNPVSGTFHSLETGPSAPSLTALSNGRYPSTADDLSGSSSGTPQYDSMSNHDSCSGESEDLKEKGPAATPTRLEAVPGSDTDKREKVRQKNEKKHQRQRERRALELHERCIRCLMSRKLEALSQQLVAMGFSSDRATMALLANGGRVEESVAWLFEGGEGEQSSANADDRSNMKIDIGDELAKIAELEVKCRCSKQEVERAIVACEGDLEKAAEALKMQKQDPSASSLKSEPAGDVPVANGVNRVVSSTLNTITRTQLKAVSSAVPPQQKRDERDFNYTKAVATSAVSLDSGGSRNLQPLRRPQMKAEWTRPQEAGTLADKSWPPNATSNPSISSYSLTSPLQVAVPPAKVEARYTVVGSEVKTNLQQTGALREPVIVMQRPQSNSRQSPPSSCVVGLNAPPAVTSGWYPNGVSNLEMMKAVAGGFGPNLHGVSLSTSSPGPAVLQYHRHNQYQPFTSGTIDPATAGLGGRWNPGSSMGTTAASSASSLAVPSSLGLFTGWGSSGSSGSSSPVDWSSTGSLMMQCDYASIDWSLDSTPMRPKLGSSSKNDRLWATTFMGAQLGRSGINGGVCIAGLQDGSGMAIDPSSSAGSLEWTTPFAGKDIFSLSRQFVKSPSL